MVSGRVASVGGAAPTHSLSGASPHEEVRVKGGVWASLGPKFTGRGLAWLEDTPGLPGLGLL